MNDALQHERGVVDMNEIVLSFLWHTADSCSSERIRSVKASNRYKAMASGLLTHSSTGTTIEDQDR